MLGKLRVFFGTVLGTMIVITVSAISLFSLPLTVIAIMRWYHFEWWSALIIAIFLGAIPFLGWVAYIITTIAGAYYFYDANFDVHRAINASLYQSTETSNADFENIKKLAAPEFVAQCKESFAKKESWTTVVKLSADAYCSCFVERSLTFLTPTELIKRPDAGPRSDEITIKLMRAARECNRLLP